jgi:hypothetical protein
METNTQTDVRSLGTLKVLELLKSQAPMAWEHAQVVGKWVWLEFDSPPEQPIREQLKALGFHWNRKRKAWQHPCGAFSMHGTGDPRFKYGTVPASILDSTDSL